MRSSPSRARDLAPAARLLVVAISVALVAASCAPAPSPAPSQPASPVVSSAAPPSEAAAPPPSGGPSPEGPDPSRPPPEVLLALTSADKILDDVAAGTLDEATGILYRVYAAFGDTRLPAKYASENWTEDNAALALAVDQVDSMPEDIAAELRPFLVRPTDRPTDRACSSPRAQRST